MFCSKCGVKLSEQSKFCSSCGFQVHDEPAEQRESQANSSKTFAISKPAIVLIVAFALVAVIAIANPKPVKTETLTGTMTLISTVDTLNEVEQCSQSVSAGLGECGNLYVDYNSLFCQGAGPFSDMSNGAVVTVTDAAGKNLSIGSIDTGVISGTDFNKGSKQVTMDCALTFKVPDVPVIDGPYLVTVGSRGSRTYTLEELESAGWNLAYTLG